MPTRRGFILTLVAGGAAAATAPVRPWLAAAADWREHHRTITFSVISSENQADLLTRHEPIRQYLERELQVKVRVTTGTDYAGTIEAMRAKKAEMAYFGPASYAKAWEVTGGNVEPFAVQTDDVGNAFYQSVIVVKATSPYQTLADLKGKSLAFADPNSTSGFQVPNYYLRKEGKIPDQFFGRTGFAGNHENGVLAVVNGTYDAACTWYRNEQRSNFQRMMDKGMIPLGAVRIVWTSPPLPESPYTLLKSLPEAMKQDIKQAMLALPERAPDAWKALTGGKAKGLAPVTHQNYVEIVELIKENERLRRAS
jgi:phosphonate transport system substrate-binding protein